MARDASGSETSSEIDPRQRPAPLSSDTLLPPVEPPSAGFLLQLFVIPAIIVACVVLLWFVIERLARSGEQDPAAIVAGLRGANGFQQAKDLADMLRVPERYPKLRTSHELAQGVAEYLTELVETGSDAEGAVTMRYFLVTLLGEMQVDDGLPALLKAAASDQQRDVRRRAVNAIAVLAGGMAELNPPQYLQSDDLADALVALANDQDELIRSETAFAIGVVAAAPEADARLVESLLSLADDPYTDARFNAATALARIGNPAAPKSVAEMFDFEALDASLTGEQPLTEGQDEQTLRRQQAYKRNTILTTALKSVGLLLDQQASPESLSVVEDALQRFVAAAPQVQDPSPIPDELLDAAERTLAKVQEARQD